MPPPSTPAPPAHGGNLWKWTMGRFWNSPSPPHQDIPRHQEHLRQQEPARSMVSKIADSGFTPKADDVYVKYVFLFVFNSIITLILIA